jgi:hypothetical protein
MLRFLSLVLAVCCCLLFGCGPAPTRLIPVSGKITIEGEPLPYGRIVLKPDATQGNMFKGEPSGEIKPDGTYTLETDGKPGAPAGIHRVAVFSVKPSTPEDGYQPPVWAASQDYSDPEKSGLTLNVVESPTPDAYDLALTQK